VRRRLRGGQPEPGQLPQRLPAPGVGRPGRHGGAGRPEAVARQLLPVVPGAPQPEKALAQVVATSCLLGISTRRVEKLAASLGVTGLSKSQVSVMAAELDEMVEGFRSPRLDGGPYTFVWIDALTQKVREGGRTVNVHCLIATGVNAERHREILAPITTATCSQRCRRPPSYGYRPWSGRSSSSPAGRIARQAGQACGRLAGVSRIVYISGRPGAGKSSLAFPLAADLGYSLVTKDMVKEALHDALYVPGEGKIDLAWSLRLSAASFAVLWTLAARAGDMVIEANFHRHNDEALRRLRGLGDQTVEVHCACPAEVAHARYNARSRHEVHQGTLPLSAMDKYDRPVGIGPLITVDTTGPVDVAAVAAEVRRLHTSYSPGRIGGA